jgi:hypothetical protein
MIYLRSNPRQPDVEAETYLLVYRKVTILERLQIFGLPSPSIIVHWKIMSLQLFGIEFQHFEHDFISMTHLLWLKKFNLGVEM